MFWFEDSEGSTHIVIEGFDNENKIPN